MLCPRVAVLGPSLLPQVSEAALGTGQWGTRLLCFGLDKWLQHCRLVLGTARGCCSPAWICQRAGGMDVHAVEQRVPSLAWAAAVLLLSHSQSQGFPVFLGHGGNPFLGNWAVPCSQQLQVLTAWKHSWQGELPAWGVASTPAQYVLVALGHVELGSELAR